MLKQWLIRLLAPLPLWTSQISIQIIDMLDLGKTLMTCSLEVKCYDSRLKVLSQETTLVLE